MSILITILYLLVAVVTWVFVYRALYRHHRREFPSLEFDDSDRMFGVVWGGFVSLLWPGTIVCYLFYRLVKIAAPLLSFLEK